MARVDTSSLEGIAAASNPVTPTYSSGLTSEELAMERARESGRIQPTAPTPTPTPVTPTKTPTTPTPTGELWQMLNGILYLNKVPFTGDKGNERYKNGILTEVAVKDENGNLVWKPAGSVKKPADTQTSTTDYTTKLQQQYYEDQKKAERQSAYDLLYSQFKQYGLESLVEPLKGLIQKDISPSQFTIELRNSPQYQTRFAANAQRVKAGFKALDEGTYLALEDAYQKLMMNYGLPNSYWEKGELGVQPGFEKLIAGNVDPVELENRLQLAVDQIEKGPKEYMDAIKQFYPDVTRSDLMAYVLDPANALKAIQSKVKAAQVGGEYLRSGLATNVARAEELSRQGVTAEMARANIPTIMEAAKRGGELAGFYQTAGLGPYDQATAEEEIYNLGRAAEARKKRQQLTSLEQAAFSGSSGANIIDRNRSGAY